MRRSGTLGSPRSARSAIRPPTIVPIAPATTVTTPNQKFAALSTCSPASSAVGFGDQIATKRSDRNVGAQYENAPIAAVCAQ